MSKYNNIIIFVKTCNNLSSDCTMYRKKIVMLFYQVCLYFEFGIDMKFWHYMGPPNDKINGINLVIRKNLYMTLTFCPIECEPFGPVC